ncbi:methylated-DNA--[protein]-cysteine S-methyltransferase [Candidatus Cytomitobacter primus]|uniref:methylated-DNA--[protein]-cysteine S-methyltransferase n=2 Tax=Candidatus Cytomitobacter primus TaxID=2066024 RepID=A0A5C0UG91_9PROT|nr:methylated-DNA--[protein]-cysteine S-methyltransferase [Candidatus Cytomitobacter primus]
MLNACFIDTKLGAMCAISDNDGLHLLKFVSQRSMGRAIEKLIIDKKATIVLGGTDHIDMIQKELALYFDGKLQEFKTPIHLVGSDFQKKAWHALMDIPYGQTRSYLEQAKAVGNSKAFRAVANANSANKFSIIIPCHRIVNHNGNLGGYAGGVKRKQWIIYHEKCSKNLL